MKVLYGVQGTGNGHLTRALAMQRAFATMPSVDVTWLLSSRPKEQGMGNIASFEWRKGLSFVAQHGRIDMIATLRQADLRQFWHDVNDIDLLPYDLVVTDYEPVLAHAARKRGIPVTGIGHQYAFLSRIPKRGANLIVDTLMRYYAPATQPVGLHWHHFDQPNVLPPIVDLPCAADARLVAADKILVYLPFEDPEAICTLLRGFPDYRFYVYHPQMKYGDQGNLCLRPISRAQFKQDLFTSSGVICNAGFELISESLQWQKKILAKPLRGQMEQLSNAAALEQLGYATVMEALEPRAIRRWLDSEAPPVRIQYPDVAQALAQWLAGGQKESVEELGQRLWQESNAGLAGIPVNAGRCGS